MLRVLFRMLRGGAISGLKTLGLGANQNPNDDATGGVREAATGEDDAASQ
jgi:hypothetical protein